MSPDLAEALGSEVTTLAFLWKLTRGDGVVLGFTSHDRDILLGGVEYLANPGMTPSAVSIGNAFSADSMEVEGVLDAATIREIDLDVGRWDGARVELFACDWGRPEAGVLRLMAGSIGDVSRQAFGAGSGFAVELISEIAVLGRYGAPACSPLCRAELGDARCRVDMEERWIDIALADSGEDWVVPEAALADPDHYTDGRLRILTGPMAGLDRRLAQVSSAAIHLEEPVYGSGLAGARARLWEGCDKRFATCSARFGNFLAFDGEPHVPGDDALVRYGEI